MKKNNFLMVISILLLIVLLIGATFSYFVASARSDQDIDAVAANFGAAVEVSLLYGDKPLIPMNDADVIKGYSNNCVDQYGYGACYAYNIHIDNTGDKFSYNGTINFNLTDIENLKYLVLDDANNEVVPSAEIIAGNELTLGNDFELDTNESKDFVLVIWLSNLAGPQDDQDGGGHFSALVTYKSSYGTRITGTFSS